MYPGFRGVTIEVLVAALAQVPGSSRAKFLVRIDGAGATHDLLEHLQALNARRTVRYTVGWMMTGADEKAIAALPETQWQTSLHQDGTAVAQAPEEADTVRTQDRLAVSGTGTCTCWYGGTGRRRGWPRCRRSRWTG
jgi:hypothetical protein